MREVLGESEGDCELGESGCMREAKLVREVPGECKRMS